MSYSNIPLAQLTVSACKHYGISKVVISPGSRNAPLTLSFLADSFFECFSIVDERAAAFFAMGMAQQDQKAVALVCTSGSAVLNYYPAVAEAYYSKIPLVVISADRPTYLIDKGYGQTIRQAGVLEKHAAMSASLIQDASHAVTTYKSFMPIGEQMAQAQIEKENEILLSTSFNALALKQQPIHLNVPFEEPLYGTVDGVSKQISFKIPKKSSMLIPDSVAAIWSQAAKIMVLVGVCPANGAEALSLKTLEFLSADPRVVVFTETTSNVSHPEFIDSIDNILAPLESHPNADEVFKSLQPELLISLGAAVVSKKIKNFLNKYRPKNHIQVGNSLVENPFFTSFIAVSATANEFVSSLAAIDLLEKKIVPYKSLALAYKTTYKEYLETYLAGSKFSDFKAFGTIKKMLPPVLQLQLANSATIRYSQLFGSQSGVAVFCNRGTSGIDGSTATAIGAAVASEKQTVFVTGDLSFFYDSNGLWNNYIPDSFRIVLINNQGGGIFRVLPGEKDSPSFDTYFETVQHLNPEFLCKLHGLEHLQVSDQASLERVLVPFFKENGGPKLLEVCTPRQENDEILKDFFKGLKELY